MIFSQSINSNMTQTVWVPPAPTIQPTIYKEVAKKTISIVDPVDLDCMSKNIYFEAAIESTAGKIAVGQVVLNRINSKYYPDTVCEVVKQGRHYPNGFPVRDRCQFSWYCDGKNDDVKNKRAYKEADKIAFLAIESYNAIKTKGLDLTEGARFYHTYAVSPRWSKVYPVVGRIGDHIFYK